MATPRAAPTPRNPWLVFAAVAAVFMGSSLQFSMVAVALPNIIDDLDAPIRWVGWIVTIFILAQAVSMPVAGKLSDEFGRRPVFLGGIAALAAASTLAALAPNIWVLIVARACQGLAAGTIMPSGFGVVSDAFALPGERARALGLVSSVFPAGSILGPNVGGLIVDAFGWRWTFALGIPVGLAAVTLLWVMLPRLSRPRGDTHIDFVGAAELAAGVAILVYGLTELGQREVSPNLAVVTACFLGALAMLALFVRHEFSTRAPIVDLPLLVRREFAYLNLLNFAYGIVIFGFFSFIPLYAREAYDMSPGVTGLLLTPRALAMIGASAGAAMLLTWSGYRWPLIVGLGSLAATFVLLSRGLHDVTALGLDVPNFVYLATLIALAGASIGVAGPASNNAGIELAPERVATVSALRGMFRSLGGAIGSAAIVLVVSRSPTIEIGLERGFLGLAVLALLAIGLVHGVPSGVGSSASAATPPLEATTVPVPAPAHVTERVPRG